MQAHVGVETALGPVWLTFWWQRRPASHLAERLEAPMVDTAVSQRMVRRLSMHAPYQGIRHRGQRCMEDTVVGRGYRPSQIDLQRRPLRWRPDQLCSLRDQILRAQ